MATTTPRALVLEPSSPTGAEIPDPDRDHPATLTWVEPLMPRPIPLGPSADHPELRPALAGDAARFWSGSRHGFDVGRRLIDLQEGAIWYAIAPDMRRAPERLSYLIGAAEAYDQAITDYYTLELSR